MSQSVSVLIKSLFALSYQVELLAQGDSIFDLLDGSAHKAVQEKLHSAQEQPGTGTRTQDSNQDIHGMGDSWVIHGARGRSVHNAVWWGISPCTSLCSGDLCENPLPKDSL